MLNNSAVAVLCVLGMGLTSCGGGSGGGATFDPQNAGVSCTDRSFHNDVIGAPSIYFNGQIPVSSQAPQGTITTNRTHAYDFAARTITVDETNTFGPGRTTSVYSLDAVGRPLKRTQQVVNFAIQLDIFTPELRYIYDENGLVTSYTSHAVIDGQPDDEPYASTTLTWTDIAGISSSVTALSDSSGKSTTTYQFNCMTLVSAKVVSESSSQPTTTSDYTVSTSGSGRAITTVTTLAVAGANGRQISFDSFGNITQVGTETFNNEPTSEQVVNIVLFENALRHRGLI